MYTPASLQLTLAAQSLPSDSDIASGKQVSSKAEKNAGTSFSGHLINDSSEACSGTSSLMPDSDGVAEAKLENPSDEPIVCRSVTPADELCRRIRLLTTSASRPSTSANISLPDIREEGAQDPQPDMVRNKYVPDVRGKYDFQALRISLIRQHLHQALEPLLSLLAEDKNITGVVRHKEDPLVVTVDMEAFNQGKIPSLGHHFASLLRYEADDPHYPYVFWDTEGCITVKNLLLIRYSTPAF
ncbi:hypothetical protein [Endozoicomonas sp. GU-1]|uniref:hypothetical protein n=1 Tax=Endozoicomonas sp. GU-1 TaxID=3009078 RepID=UPI0022B3DA19|nr:hypothetical protein [Endozoicomonas sp. GU-1]WBA80070.1 hypothetical protein O2T12_17135 [Endozoicomonas sp. GU-1]WBA87643.1 hypothetical protein O3276_06360 [Endozoicomonas sp. GU-1]